MIRQKHDFGISASITVAVIASTAAAAAATVPIIQTSSTAETVNKVVQQIAESL